jgi:hypothetical protein
MSRSAFLVAWIAWSCAIAPAIAQTRPAPDERAVTGMTLGRLAPENVVFCLASNGWKKAPENSTNKAELLWAVPSVQEFIQQLSDEIKRTIEEQSGQNESASLAMSTVPVLLKAAIEHPLVVSLESFTVANPPKIVMSVIIDTESDADAVREAFDKLIQASQRTDMLVEEKIRGTSFYTPRNHPADDAPLPQFGMFKSYLILTMGQETTTNTLKRISATNKSPAWLDGLLRDLKVERPTLAWQVNAAPVREGLDPLIQDPQVRKGLEAAGLFALNRIAAGMGLDSTGNVEKMFLETSGAPGGLFGLLPNKPLLPADLKNIPAQPAQAMIVRFDLAYLVDELLKIADQIDPLPRQQFDELSEQDEEVLGFSIKDDLLKAFGDVWSSYVSTTEAGGGLVPGLVIAATVRDAKKMTKVQEALVSRAKDILGQLGPHAPVSLHEFTARGTKGYRVQINNLPIPLAPSWVVTKDQFVIGLSPQLVTAHLTVAKTSLADNVEVQAALKRDPKSILISYRDPRPELQGFYTVVNTVAPLLTGQLQQQGIEFNLPPLPPYSDIEPHLAPTVGTLSRNATGWASESHGVAPSFNAASPAIAAGAVALLLPAVQQAREAARRTQSKNNMKQIGLAMHNYHDTYLNFPERVVLDKQDKPGLSWRVKLLPFLDQGELYSKFHLDEPWDSDHNKQLIERMPAVYSSPNDPDLMTQGKTRYLVPVGDGTLFDGEKGPRIRDITDGTSNTIMAVEAHHDSAVIWTKPDDLDIDFDEPLLGLQHSRNGGFHVLLADGSVRFVSDNIDPETLKKLFTRAGAEIIGGF